MTSSIEKLLADSEKIRVLLIEDNKADAKLVREMLKESNLEFNITEVERLAQGVQQLTDNNFDVVLLDLGLPDCVGISTFIQIKTAATFIPIIVLTGTDLKKQSIKHCMESADEFLVKGQIKSKDLTDSIKRVIEKTHTRSKLQAHFLTPYNQPSNNILKLG